MGKGSRWAVWIITLLAATLRLIGLGANSLWFDEAFSWLAARQPMAVLLTQRLEPFLPPLYHVLLHLWLRLGESEVALRSFSALCGLLSVPAIYCLGRELFTPQAGRAAALLTAISPFHIYYAQEARPYALIILLATLLLWAFVRAWKRERIAAWALFGLLAALNFYAHYFVAFVLLALHAFILLAARRDRRRWRGLLLADLIALLLVAPHLPAAWARTGEVVGHFWLAQPSPLQPFKTLVYLLFGHTVPFALLPATLFLVLSTLVLVIVAAVRARGDPRRRLLLLIGILLTPMLGILLVSWLSGPLYLDRSFSLVAPAYALLLGWGLAHPPRGSPLRLLFGGLAIVAVATLGNYYLTADPARPPFRDAGQTLVAQWQEGDVVLHLHDSSYLPLCYYAPQAEAFLLDNDPDAWLPPATWEWAGRRTTALQPVVTDRSRLWVVIMPLRLTDRQSDMLAQIESRFAQAGGWTWAAAEPVDLRLYVLDGGEAP